MTKKIAIYDIENDTLIVEEMSADESVKNEMEVSVIESIASEMQANAEAKRLLKESALAKLSSIGLTEEELSEILGVK